MKRSFALVLLSVFALPLCGAEVELTLAADSLAARPGVA